MSAPNPRTMPIQQSSTGGFKLKIKLAGPPSLPTPALSQPPPPPPRTAPAPPPAADEDEQEDQLASSNGGADDDDDDSLSSAPPLPPPPKRTKPKAPSLSASAAPRPAKKRRTLPTETAAHPIPPPPAAHTQLQAEDLESELSSYASDQAPRPPKLKKIKLANPGSGSGSGAGVGSKAKLARPKMVPLTDAELLSAAGSQFGEDSALQAGPAPPALLQVPAKAPLKKKKSPASHGDALRKRPPPPVPQPAELLAEPELAPIAHQTLSVKPPSKPLPGVKTKSKKGSKLSQASQEPVQPPAPAPAPAPVLVPVVLPPPQPRLQHDYTLGPPPPPPVPAFKPFAVGVAPRPQGPFLPAQPLDKASPKVRTWKKTRRIVVGVSGIPFWVWTYAGDEHSDYAAFKQSKAPQLVGTPTGSAQANYFATAQPSRPASAASSHTKPSPIRNNTGERASRAKYHVDPPVPNLGGPALPASFRRPPLSMGGSPLSFKETEGASHKPGQMIARSSKNREGERASEGAGHGDRAGHISTSQTDHIHAQQTGKPHKPDQSNGSHPSHHHQHQHQHQHQHHQLQIGEQQPGAVGPGIIKLPELAIPK